jgi:ribosomal protein L13
MPNYKIKVKERHTELCETLTYYSKYGTIKYNAPESEWNEFFKNVLPSELQNVLNALSKHLNIYENETENDTAEAAAAEPSKRKKKGK